MHGVTRRRAGAVVIAALAVLLPAASRAATLNLQITATADDALEQGNNVRQTNALRLYVWQDTAANTLNYRAGGVRFAGVTIPQGSTINSATLRLTIPAGGNDDFYATIWGHATDNAADFALANNPYILSQVAEPNGRPRTTANAPFALLNMGTGARDFGVTSIVQEIVNRAGWQSGNALALLMIPGVGPVQRADFCDVSSGVGCAAATWAQLLLDYTPPSIVLESHGSGQIPDQFTTFPTVANAPLFRFRLTNTTAGPVTVDRLVVRLSQVYKISRFDVSGLRINDGTVDVSAGGIPYIGGTAGTFTFDADFTVPASSSVDYTVYGTVTGLEPYDMATLSLQPGDITLVAGTQGGNSPASATHLADSPLGRMNVISSQKVALGAPNNLEYSQFGTTWSPAPGVVGVNDIPDSLWWKALVTKPDYSEQAAVVMTDGGGGRPRLHASFWDGTSWNYGTTTPLQDSYDVAAPSSGMEGGYNRTFGAAYEAVSGRLVIASGINTVGTIRYSVWDGTSWFRNFVTESSMGVNGWYQWTKLVSIPGTNKVAFIGICSAPGAGDGSVAIWNGDTNAWVNKSGIGLTSNNVLGQAFDMKAVRGGSNAGEILAAYAQSNVIRFATYRTNNPAPAWNVGSIAATLGAGNNPQWLRLAADPADGDMVLAFETSTNEIRTITYNGSTRTWGTVSAALSTAAYGNVDYNRPFDVVWDAWGGANSVLLVYSDATAIRYRRSTDGGASWGAEQTLDATRQAYWVQAATEPNGFVHLAVNDQNDDLNAWTWDGSAWTFQTPTAIENDLGWANNASHDHAIEPFALAEFPAGGSGRTYYRSIGTAADYTAGTVTVASGSTSVTGTGTAWKANNRGRGDRITIGANSYVILSVDSDTQITLASAAVAAATNSAYTIARQFTTLQAWEDCISFATPCTYFPVTSADLVADNRSEIGIAYEDSTFTWASAGTAILTIDGTTTDPSHTITLTADGSNRHYGVPGGGVTLDNSGNNSVAAILVLDDHVTLEWLEVLAPTAPSMGIDVGGQLATDNLVRLRWLIVHDTVGRGINLQWPGLSAVVSNNFVYDTGGDAIHHDPTPGLQPGRYVQFFNNTVRNAGLNGFGRSLAAPTVLVRNNACSLAASLCFQWAGGSISPQSSHNYASDSTGTVNSPAGGGLDSVPDSGAGGFNFVDGPNGNLHLQATSVAINGGVSLSPLIDAFDIDAQSRSGAWDVGADEFGATTAVTLTSFEAVPGDASVALHWRTASELDNLGFRLHRSTSAAGPWERITPQLVPGLGSSPLGAAYSWLDGGLANGTRYFYRLEDVDTSALSTFHGPVSAVPGTPAPVPAPAPAPPGGGGGGTGGGGGPGAAACPSWVLAAASGASPSSCRVYGEPEAVSVEVVSRTARGAVVELRTGGFYAVRDASGLVRAFVPGMDGAGEPGAPALPVKRTLVDAVVGRSARLVSVRELDRRAFPGLRPAALGEPELVAPGDGTLRPSRRAARLSPTGHRFVPADAALLAGSAFQGEEKSAVLDLAPLRYDAARDRLVLARRLVVRLAFDRREAGESGTGRLGRRVPRSLELSREVLAELLTTRRGLHAVRFEELFPGRTRPVPLAHLRLQQQGRAVAFRVEPPAADFSPGGVLYFFADVEPASVAFSGEVAWQLVRGEGGLAMATRLAPPAGEPASGMLGRASFERNRIHQPGLLNAPDPWLWEGAAARVSRTVPFVLSGTDPGGALARVVAHLQGGSDALGVADHHVRVLVNDALAGEATFDGKRPFRLEAAVPASALREGANTLTLENVGDTGVASLVLLDRFEIEYPRSATSPAASVEASWPLPGAAEVAVGSPVAVLDVTPGEAPAWLAGFEGGPSSVRFAAEAGRVYAVVGREGRLAPRVRPPAASSLRAASNRADFLVIGPRDFLDAVRTLVERREAQGLATRAVALEEIATAFGGGEASGEAVRAFLSHAFHAWARPSPRYVLLVGDGSDDPRNFTGSATPAPMPVLRLRTSWLWTAADPALGAVNGEDLLPDLAIGRLPAKTPGDAARLVAKILDWEDAGNDLAGTAVLVADDPDAGGDFEANARELAAGPLAGRSVETILLREKGASTRDAIYDAFARGASLLSYVGHGGTAVWASENVLNTWDAPLLPAASRQPVVLTLNCLNGYFTAPSFDALTEALLGADGRGAVAGISPSSASLDAPAHAYHRALAGALTSPVHGRLGDALLAAQREYARGGAMPELLAVYHLFGDPTMRLRP